MITLITGMSGTGKSTIITELLDRGCNAIDLDGSGWSQWVPCEGNPTGANPGHDWQWNGDRLSYLLDEPRVAPLFIAGCAPNMGRFRSRFDHIILLTAPLDVILDRVATRKTNTYGQTTEEADRIAANFVEIQPLLRRSCTHEIDVTKPVDRVVDEVLATQT